MQTKSLNIAIIFLLITSIFDPADLILGLKIPIFIINWLIFILILIKSNRSVRLTNNLSLYLLTFIILLPAISTLRYVLFNIPSDEYILALWFCIKPLFFLSFLIILHDQKLDITETTSIILTYFSIAIICVLLLFINGYEIYNNKLINTVYEKGLIQKIDYRNYGELNLPYIYFVTAPLLVISTAFYSEKFFISFGKAKFKYFIILLINISAFFLTGSRNSIIISIVTPLIVFLAYYKKKKIALAISCLLIAFIAFYYKEVLFSMLSSKTDSNLARLSMFNDYITVFNNPYNLLFGQGLGSSFYVTVNNSMQWIAELTFFEIIRHYGLIMGGILISMLLFPYIMYKRYANQKFLLIAYTGYLIMCFTNPFIFSSSGMIMLSLVLYRAFEQGTSSVPNLS